MVKNDIKVFARLKPEAREKNIVNYQIHRRPKKNVEEDYLVLTGHQKSTNEYINNRPESWNFAFHKIFDVDVKQDDIFEKVARPIVQSVLNGYNATIFAYGQTGSGKTFSITGDTELYDERGVLPRTIQYLFQTIKKNPENLYSVEIAYLEIYNENGYDLLDPKHEVVTKLEDLPRVTIQEDETGRLHLKNLCFRCVENEKEALDLLFLGDTNRAISETPMNPQSSRSHCIFTIAVSVKQSGAQHLSKAKMHLVDLAGSERVYKCCISGSILTEAKHINLSLHYLEQVIVCLGQQNVNHIPYRNSLLTAILRDSLGGNCLTTMLATLSLNTSNLEETISTCRFSQRVALIKNDVNLVLERNPEDENKFLKIEVQRLKNQIAQLTKRPISEELTQVEKQDLDLQVLNFVKSGEPIELVSGDDRKMKYCLEILQDKFKTRNGEEHNFSRDIKDLNYYRNLIVQRDKEISVLIDMLKVARKNSSEKSKNVQENGESLSSENSGDRDKDKISPRILVIAKRMRLREIITKARSIADLIRKGKASIGENKANKLARDNEGGKNLSKIYFRRKDFLFSVPPALDLRGSRLVAGDLRTRIGEGAPLPTGAADIRLLRENLRDEQSRLANNLALLKILKSEATELKSELSREGSSDLPDDGTEGLETARNLAANVPPNAEVGFANTADKNCNPQLSEWNQPALGKDIDPETRRINSGDSRTVDNFTGEIIAVSETPLGGESSESSSGASTLDAKNARPTNGGEINVEKESDDLTGDRPRESTPVVPGDNERSKKIGGSQTALDEDDEFMKSLPLTGDPEIDEEIIAFYRAKRSGGTY
ncbi:kinesin-like protein KIF6 [Athalia rosae]|uniref:kinesin-like protein KIF6 n=1 Tax=Athalia rosae TaxID=37344 RepID=UPI0020336AA7|nr:kinesin-like protein KIF6 [Athalia rosae]